MALTFNGVDEYLSCATMGNYGGGMATNKPTVALWVKTTSEVKGFPVGNYNGSLQTQLTPSLNEESDGTVTSGAIRGFLRDDDNTYLAFGVDTDTGFNDGAWHSIVWSHDGPNDKGYIWLDGVAQTLAYAAQLTPDNFSNFSDPMFIGTASVAGVPSASYFAGSLADVRFYDKLWTTTEALIFHHSRGSDNIVDHLVARYQLAQGPDGTDAAGTIADLSGNGYSATVVNDPDWLAAPLRVCKPPLIQAD